MTSGVAVNASHAGGTVDGEDRVANIGRASHRYRY